MKDHKPRLEIDGVAVDLVAVQGLGPGDILAVKHPARLSRAAMADIKRAMRGLVPDHTKIMLLPDGMDIEVVQSAVNKDDNVMIDKVTTIEKRVADIEREHERDEEYAAERNELNDG